MESRERVIRAIGFEGPDRVPNSYFGLYEAAYGTYGESLKKILAKYPSDFASSGFVATGIYRREISRKDVRMRRFVDEWGCVWARLHDGLAGQCCEHPLSSWDFLDDYEFPEPPVFKKESDRDQSKYVMGTGGTLFERMQQLRGFQNLLTDIVKERKEVRLILDRIVKYNLELVQRVLETDVDGVYFADDWGTQTGMMISPDVWRKIFKPAYEKMFRGVRAAGRNVVFHSDGYMPEIIPDLISCGMDVFYPQFGVTSVDEWEEICGGKVCIIASTDVQKILPRGTADDVKHYAKQMIEKLGSYDGGLINAPEISWGIPVANIEASFGAFWKYGRYPRCPAVEKNAL